MNRRVGFFAGAGAVCFVLVPLIDEKFHWVPESVGALYLLLAALAALDALGRRKL
ncbi:MAG TPA: hypothetical protein VF519_18090 [Mycobacteriales bacterium]